MSTSEMSVEEAVKELEGFINFFDTYYEEISEYSDYEYEDTKRQCEATKIVLQELRRLQGDKKSINEWEKVFNVKILDPDGFDRTDPKLFERLFTMQEFNKALVFCTIEQG